MVFVAFAIVIVIGLALAISTDMGAAVGLSQGQTASLVPLVILLTLFASAIVRQHRLREIVSGFAIWIAIGAVLVLGYAYRFELQSMGQRVVSVLQPGTAVIDANTGNVLVSRGFGGSFRVDTQVNGAPVPMIFDTGASAVVLSLGDAEAAGIDTANLSYSVPVQTANGTGWAAPIRIDRLEVGNIIRNGVRAFIVADNALETSLLGMTFLETLSQFTVAQDSLILHD